MCKRKCYIVYTISVYTITILYDFLVVFQSSLSPKTYALTHVRFLLYDGFKYDTDVRVNSSYTFPIII